MIGCPCVIRFTLVLPCYWCRVCLQASTMKLCSMIADEFLARGCLSSSVRGSCGRATTEGCRSSSSATSLISTGLHHRQALHNTVVGKHAHVGRELLADSEGVHSCILLSQYVGHVSKICLILPAIDKDEASESTASLVDFVHWISPASSSAEIFEILHVKASTHVATDFDSERFRYWCPSKMSTTMDRI